MNHPTEYHPIPAANGYIAVYSTPNPQLGQEVGFIGVFAPAEYERWMAEVQSGAAAQAQDEVA